MTNKINKSALISIKFNDIANEILGENDYLNLKKIILKLMKSEKDKKKRTAIVDSFIKIISDTYLSNKIKEFYTKE